MSIVITDDLSEIGILPGENSVISVYIRDNDSKAMHYVHALSCIISGVTAALSVSDSSVKEGNKCKVTVSLNQVSNQQHYYDCNRYTICLTRNVNVAFFKNMYQIKRIVWYHAHVSTWLT